MKKYIKKIAVFCLTLTLLLPLTGCAWFDQADQIKDLEGEVESYEKQITLLKQQVNDTTVKEIIPETSLQAVEGSTQLQFMFIADRIVFPNKLQLPDSSDDISNSNIMVGSKFRFVPSDNWLSKMRGSQLDLNHPAKIWGSIKGVILKEKITEANMQPLLQQFFIGFPSTTITYRKVFIEDAVAGMLASAPITVEGKDFVVTVGFAQRAENAVLFLFTHEDDKSGVQKELIDLLLRSGTYAESRIKLE